MQGVPCATKIMVHAVVADQTCSFTCAGRCRSWQVAIGFRRRWCWVSSSSSRIILEHVWQILDVILMLDLVWKRHQICFHWRRKLEALWCRWATVIEQEKQHSVWKAQKHYLKGIQQTTSINFDSKWMDTRKATRMQNKNNTNEKTNTKNGNRVQKKKCRKLFPQQRTRKWCRRRNANKSWHNNFQI